MTAAHTARRQEVVYLSPDQAYLAGLVRAEFGPLARIVVFDGDDGNLYAEVEAGASGHCIQMLDPVSCESVWMGDCHEGVANRVTVSDFRKGLSRV